ncbi:ester cyclase [Arthrobacter sp. ISL-28]|uniref:ester cyclase n=1 Tax=Arthrobacter sp. ISL-28 TaxID=2819108 RepID=UPI001BED2A9B|nr:ester cyclase [Arthrobacter sp. ISL-28]MBT2523066.1 ester cyclase [Arthrobacter sp. ISL-28]
MSTVTTSGEPTAITLSAKTAAVTRAWAAAWNEGDTSLLEALLDPGYRRRSAGSGRSESATELLVAIRSARAAFPDLTTIIDAIVEEGDQMAIFWHSTGTHQNEFLGVPPTRRSVETFGSNHCIFRNGSLVEENVTWDPRQLLSALGIISLESE